ncbi:hypothetical protein RCL1_007702 [Eukaryota sp. TZLM3-RCL]
MVITRSSTRLTSFGQFFSPLKKKPISSSMLNLSPSTAERKRLQLRYKKPRVVSDSVESRSSTLSESFPSLDSVSSGIITDANSSTLDESFIETSFPSIPYSLPRTKFQKVATIFILSNKLLYQIVWNWKESFSVQILWIKVS